MIQELPPRADNDRRSLESWHEWEISGRERRIILCVGTNLEMRAGYPGYDSRKLDALVDEAIRLMRSSPNPIDAIRIVPQR